MQFKLLALPAVLFLVVASLFVAGCTTSTTSNTNQTTTPSTTTPDTVLERFVTAYKAFVTDALGPGNGTITDWQVTWHNNTTANIRATAHYTQANVTVMYNRTVTSFSSTDAASAHLANYNLTGYVPSTNLTIERGNVSQTALGHPLTVLKAYGKVSEDLRTTFEVEQADNLFIITDSTVTISSS
jgi:hypothetical protein